MPSGKKQIKYKEFTFVIFINIKQIWQKKQIKKYIVVMFKWNTLLEENPLNMNVLISILLLKQ